MLTHRGHQVLGSLEMRQDEKKGKNKDYSLVIQFMDEM